MHRLIYTRTLLILCSILYLHTVSYAQAKQASSELNYGHCLTEVHFGKLPLNTTGSFVDYIVIDKDDGSGPFRAPQLKYSYTGGCRGGAATVINNYPVAYVSGSKMKLRAVFETDCTNSYFIRAVATGCEGVYEFPAVELEPVGGQVVYEGKDPDNSPWLEADKAFPINMIQKCELSISWEMSYNGISDWINLDESTHQVYITRGGEVPSDVQKPYHTVLDVSCGQANGMTGSEQDIVDKIWEAFGQKNGAFPGIERAGDGHILTYYENPNGSSCAGDLGGLLTTGDGKCGAWREFLLQCIRVQNIDGVNEVLMFPNGEEGNPNSAGTLMSQNEIDAVKLAVDINFPVNLAKDVPIPIWNFLVKNWYGIQVGDIIPLLYDHPNTIPSYEIAVSQPGDAGVLGQGNVPEPKSIFSNHAILFYENSNIMEGGTTYDPSYGKSYAGLGISEFEDHSVVAVQGCVVWVKKADATTGHYFYVTGLNTINQQDMLHN